MIIKERCPQCNKTEEFYTKDNKAKKRRCIKCVSCMRHVM